MKFDTPAGTTPADQLKVLGQPVERVDGPLKVTGQARYAYEWHDQPGQMAYGYILGAAIGKGRITALDTAAALAAPGVIAVLTHQNVPALGTGDFYVQRFLAAPQVDHYHQPVAVVVAETFEQARAGAALVRCATRVSAATTTWRPSRPVPRWRHRRRSAGRHRPPRATSPPPMPPRRSPWMPPFARPTRRTRCWSRTPPSRAGKASS